MAVTANDVLTLAKSTKSLPQEQIARIEQMIPKMSQKELEQLFEMLQGLQEEEIQHMEKELELWNEVGQKMKGYKREDRKEKEATDREGESAELDTLIDKL